MNPWQGGGSGDFADLRARLLERAVAAERDEALAGTNKATEPLSLWWGLVEGRWRFVERFETDGRRYYVGCENPPGTSRPTALNPRERLLVALLGAGESEKSARYALGVGPSAVSRLLKTTLAKLGMRSRTELVLFMRAVGLSHEQLTTGSAMGRP
jgi:DNA-binding CsgD family transcriptional regulator